jgi:hypothetical protein
MKRRVKKLLRKGLNSPISVSGGASVANSGPPNAAVVEDPPAAVAQTGGTESSLASDLTEPNTTDIPSSSETPKDPEDVLNPAKVSIGLNTSSLELNKAICDFETNYKRFSKKYVLVDKDLETAFQNADNHGDFRQNAKIFQANISTAINTVEKHIGIAKGKWTYQVGHFLTKLYPLARLACGLTAAAAEVLPG